MWCGVVKVGVVWCRGCWGGGYLNGIWGVDSVLDFTPGKFFQFWKLPPPFCIKFHV